MIRNVTGICKTVSKDAHTFWHDTQRRIIEHRPTSDNEITQPLANVAYSRD